VVLVAMAASVAHHPAFSSSLVCLVAVSHRPVAPILQFRVYAVVGMIEKMFWV